MSFRDIEERRADIALRERSSEVRRLYTTLFALYALAGLGYLAFVSGFFQSDTPVPHPRDQVIVSFGFNRLPITRSFAVDLQSSLETQAVENLTVRLQSDLRHISRTGEFPADQITVGVSRLAAASLNLSLTANPWEPERVREGTYEGTIQIRGNGISEDVGLSVWLQNRDEKWALVAGLLVGVGALVGLLLKWITERLTPQAALARRAASLRHSIGAGEDASTLPIGIRLRLEKLEDEISREDYAAAETSFQALERDSELLAGVSYQVQSLMNKLSIQQQFVDKSRIGDSEMLLLQGVVEHEYQDVQDLLTTSWNTDKERTDLGASVHAARLRFDVIQAVMFAFANDRPSALRGALLEFQAGGNARGEELFREWKVAAPATELSAVKETVTSEARAQRRPRSMRPQRPRMKFLFRYARGLAGAASVVLVGLVGLKLEYLDNQNFSGGLSDWLGLALWGAAIELSGVSVLEVVGRLSSRTPAVTKTP